MSKATGRRSRSTWRPGRDARAEWHPPQPGRHATDRRRHHVVVAGGGIAGLAAATGLAERGVRVTVLERERQLGGRVSSWPVTVGGETVSMSRGFHAFFRQYYNLRSLLRRSDPGLERLRAVDDYPLTLRGGPTDSFARVARTPPLNLVSFVLRSPTFRLRDLAAVDVPAALELLDVDFPGTFERYDGTSAAEFLDRLRFPDAARHLALEVFARSFFADPREFSAGELVGMFHTYFLGSAEGLLFDVPRDDYETSLWHPLAAYLRGLAVEVCTGRELVEVRRDGDQLRLETSGVELSADGLVLAVDPASWPRLDLGQVADLRDQQTAPPFAVWRLWLDRAVVPGTPAFRATSGFGPLDNVSVLELLERGAADWSARHGGSVVELHAYAVPTTTTEADLRSGLWEGLVALHPELRGAGVRGESFLWRQDCPLVGTAPWQHRPGVRTADRRIVLAGDGVRCELPVALMERAATTGWQAADLLLAEWDVAGHGVWSTPTGPRHRLVPALHRLVARTSGSPTPSHTP